MLALLGKTWRTEGDEVASTADIVPPVVNWAGEVVIIGTMVGTEDNLVTE